MTEVVKPARLNKRPSGNRAVTTSKNSLRRSYNAMRKQRNAVVKQRDEALAIVTALSLCSACPNCGGEAPRPLTNRTRHLRVRLSRLVGQGSRAAPVRETQNLISTGLSKVWPRLSRWCAQGSVCELTDLRFAFKDRSTHPIRVVSRDTGDLIAIVFHGPDHDAFMANIYEGNPKDGAPDEPTVRPANTRAKHTA